MEKNIFEYDKLNIYAKKQKSEEIIERYKCFNWTLDTETDNDKYEDLQDLTFSRPHKIKNKDDLQLMQVHMEENLNLIGKLEKYRHARSQTFGLCVGGIGFACLVIAIWLLVIHNFVPAVILLGITLGCAILVAIFLPKILKKEKNNYEFHHKRLETEVNEICEKAKTLSGGEYEK